MQLSNLRIALAEAKIALRQAKDYETIARAIAEQAAIERLNGSAGKNEAERARNLTTALTDDNYYQNALTVMRDAEAKVDRLTAEIAVEEDAIRANEARIREKLADALLGRRVDDAAGDCTCDECLARREEQIENYAKGFPYADPGSNAGGEYPR